MPRGKKGFQKGHPTFKGVEKGWFKKDTHPNSNTEFKKGNKPWNWLGGKETYEGKLARQSIENKYNKAWEELHLPENPIIHHINHNRKDNNFENLCIMSNEEHTRFHKRGEI